uniref:Uncharacterized protein n=1 Tax=viral metagenome TaxID=1070528 RepID=A0A6C0J2D1_9ZZZZ
MLSPIQFDHYSTLYFDLCERISFIEQKIYTNMTPLQTRDWMRVLDKTRRKMLDIPLEILTYYDDSTPEYDQDDLNKMLLRRQH